MAISGSGTGPQRQKEAGKKDPRLARLETELKLRGFSQRTIKTYLYQNTRFLDFCQKKPDEVMEEDVKAYMAYLVADRGLAPGSVILTKAAIRFFYEEVLGKAFIKLKTPKSQKSLPVVLTKDEVKRLIAAAGSKKAQLLLTLLYSSGLRLSEAIGLKYGDLEPESMVGWVRKGKGGKDRMFILSDSFSKGISKMMEKANSDDYIFTGHLGKPISPRGVQGIVKRAATAAGIKKDVHPHTLRHCFATHLLESGVGIRQIQELLGHSNLQTTQIYTKVSTDELKKIKSPMDTI